MTATRSAFVIACLSARPPTITRGTSTLRAGPRRCQSGDGAAHEVEKYLGAERVLDDEHATSFAAEGRHDDDLAGLGHGRDTDREVEREGRSPPFALGTEPAAVLLDDAVGDGQAEAGAGAHLLGREERLEDARQHLRWDEIGRAHV